MSRSPQPNSPAPSGALPPPTWQTDDGAIVLYRGDSLRILPQLEAASVDAVVTDPPFGIDFKYDHHDDDPDTYPAFMRAAVTGSRRLVRGDDGPCFFWQGMLNADRWHEWFPKGFRIFAACKGFVQYRKIPVQYSWDPVIFWGAARGDPSVWRKDFHVQRIAEVGAGRPKVPHPCPRPLEQVEYVVRLASREGDTILDPFVGSGTTGIACVRTGRRFIGIEKDAGYFRLAVKRIREAIRKQKAEEGLARREMPLREMKRLLIAA